MESELLETASNVTIQARSVALIEDELNCLDHTLTILVPTGYEIDVWDAKQEHRGMTVVLKTHERRNETGRSASHVVRKALEAWVQESPVARAVLEEADGE